MRRRLLLVINHGVNMHKLFIVCLLSLTAASANAQSCPDPSQLERERDLVDNLVDTRTAGLLPPRVWHKMRWAPGHNKPVDAIVAIEAREPRRPRRAKLIDLVAAQILRRPERCPQTLRSSRRHPCENSTARAMLGSRVVAPGGGNRSERGKDES